MLRRTKIVATMGPATDSLEVLTEMMRAGVDVARLNASHGTVADRRRRLALVREAAQRADKCVGVLLDLGGPKIRIECFRDGPVQLAEGAAFTLDTALDPKAGTEARVGVAYQDLPRDVAAGDTLLLNDGQIVLDVERVGATTIDTRVRVGGELSDRKGVNRQGGGISAPAVSARDHEDIQFVAEEGVDYMAVSFARDAAGRYPVKAVQAMAQVIEGAEKYQLTHTLPGQRIKEGQFQGTEEAIAMAVMYTANHMKVRAIVALTESGATPLWMSRIRSDIPVYAFTRHESTRRRVTLYRGVYPVIFDVTSPDSMHELYRALFKRLLELQLVKKRDLVILTKGELSGVQGGTNSMMILKVALD